MAQIMNLQLKAVKTFVGHDGYGLNANLYLNNKKVAFVLDEGCGGELDIQFFDKEKRDEVFAIANRYYKKYPKFLLYDADWAKLIQLVEELYALHETEKYFKKMNKKGYPIVVEIRYCKRADNFLENYDATKKDCMVALKVWNEETKKMVLEEYEPAEYKVYEKLEDFVVE